MSIRDMILAANDLPLHKEAVPEWGCDVFIKPLNGHQRSKLVKAVQAGGVLYGVALASSLCDPDGNPLFSESDVDALNGKSGKVLERLSNLIVKLNGLGGDAVADSKND